MRAENEAASGVGGGLGGWEVDAASFPTAQVSTPEQSPSTLDLTHERRVLQSLAHILASVLPARSAISQHVLDEIVAGWNDLADVDLIIGRALLQPAGPEVRP